MYPMFMPFPFMSGGGGSDQGDTFIRLMRLMERMERKRLRKEEEAKKKKEEPKKVGTGIDRTALAIIFFFFGFFCGPIVARGILSTLQSYADVMQTLPK